MLSGRYAVYAGRVACCSLVSHGRVAYADGTDRQTDGRQAVTSRFRYGRGQRNSNTKMLSVY